MKRDIWPGEEDGFMTLLDRMKPNGEKIANTLIKVPTTEEKKSFWVDFLLKIGTEITTAILEQGLKTAKECLQNEAKVSYHENFNFDLNEESLRIKINTKTNLLQMVQKQWKMPTFYGIW